MRESRLVLLTASLETRVRRIVEEYHVVDEPSRMEADRIICSLKPILGGKQVDYLRDCLRQGEIPEVVRVLLREHYDPRYEYAMSGYQYALGVSTENLDVAVDELLKYHENFMQVTDFKD
jgi:tRNA 2-selenouridine synthase